MNTNSFQPYDFSALIASIIEPNHSGSNDESQTDTSVITDTSVNVISGDNIKNDSDNVTLNAQGSSTTIRNSGNDVKINGSPSNDEILNGGFKNSSENWTEAYVTGGNRVTIEGNAGDDLIENYRGSNIMIDGGADSDRIYNSGINNIIDGGDGEDTIKNYAYEVSITSVTINGGTGNDSIYSDGNAVNIDGGTGNDSISNSGVNVTINGNVRDDYIRNYGNEGGGKNVTIAGGSGKDTIQNGSTINSDGTFIGGGDDNADYIFNSGNNATINGGDGEDTIINSGEKVTISGENGNDSIRNMQENVFIDSGLGDDHIQNFGKNTTLYGSSGYDHIENTVDSVMIDAGNDDDVVKNWRTDEQGFGIIRSGGDNVTINGGSGNDSLYTCGTNVIINGGEGQDYIYCDKSDRPYSERKKSNIIYGGDNNDTIEVNGVDYSTIYGGLGEDVISLSSDILMDVIVYGVGDGNDTVVGYTNACELQIAGDQYSTVQNENDTIVYVGDGSIVLKDWKVGWLNITTIENPMPISVESIQKSDDTYEYTGGDKVITDYSSDSKIQLTEPISNVEVVSDTFVVKASTGDLVIENVVDKVIEFTNKDGNTTAYAYMAGDSKEVNGSTSSNNLIAGSGGSSLIGGGGDNTLQGGAGRDVFVYSSGNNLVKNYESGDIVKLATSYDNTDVKENNLVIKSTVGNLTIENVEEKIVDVTNTDGTLTQIYVARESGGEVAGNALGNSPEIFKIIVGAEDNKNHLIAGDGGSSLIGGKTDDILQGGIGHDAFSYSSGNDTITNYESLEEITFNGTYQNWITDGNDFVLNAAEGSLRITDAREKLIRVKNLDGSILMGVYMSDEEDVYDYSNYGEFITAIGSNKQRNTLIAGSAGSVLWGGDGKAWDEMYGGTGVDEFVYRYGNGADAIFNASYEDTVNLADITFDQIVGTRLTPNRALFVFTDYGSLNILGQAGNFIIDGQSYNADYNNNQLQAK